MRSNAGWGARRPSQSTLLPCKVYLVLLAFRPLDYQGKVRPRLLSWAQKEISEWGLEMMAVAQQFPAAGAAIPENWKEPGSESLHPSVLIPWICLAFLSKPPAQVSDPEFSTGASPEQKARMRASCAGKSKKGQMRQGVHAHG